MIGTLTVGTVWDKTQDTVIYIGRNSKYGSSPLANPFPITATHSREDVIKQYETYLIYELNQGNKIIQAEMNRIGSLLLEGNNVVLGCYCKGKGHEDRSCHGEIIKEIIDDAISNKVIEPINKVSDYV